MLESYVTALKVLTGKLEKKHSDLVVMNCFSLMLRKSADPCRVINYFAVRCLDSEASLVLIFEISKLLVEHVSEQTDRDWKKTHKTDFLTH